MRSMPGPRFLAFKYCTKKILFSFLLLCAFAFSLVLLYFVLACLFLIFLEVPMIGT